MNIKLHFSYSSFVEYGDGTYEGDIRTLRRVAISFYMFGFSIVLLGVLLAFQDCFPGLLCMFMGLAFVLIGHRALRKYEIYKAMEDEKRSRQRRKAKTRCNLRSQARCIERLAISISEGFEGPVSRQEIRLIFLYKDARFSIESQIKTSILQGLCRTMIAS